MGTSIFCVDLILILYILFFLVFGLFAVHLEVHVLIPGERCVPAQSRLVCHLMYDTTISADATKMILK